MLTFSPMAACTTREALPMADHLAAPTASLELASDLASYDFGDRHAGQRSVASLRPDLDPRLVEGLEIGPDWAELDGLAGLLAGRTARGNAISGMETRTPWRSLAEAFGLEPTRLPYPEEIEAIANGRLANGDPAPKSFKKAAGKILALYGLKHDAKPDSETLRHIAAGRSADGSAANAKAIGAELWRARGSSVSTIHLTFNASKSLSVGFALRSSAERAILLHAHREAVGETMVEVERLVAQVRRGDGGQVVHPAAVLWFRLTHYTGRPTKVDDRRVAGDPHLHEHVVLACTAIADDGRWGKIDLAMLHARIAQLGASYNLNAAKWLRSAGVAVSLHPRQDCLRLDDVPQTLEVLFSKRTGEGTRQAEGFADARGFGLAALPHRTRATILKHGVQGDPFAARRDDVADLGSWRDQAAEIGAGVPRLVHLERRAIGARLDPSKCARETAERRLATAVSERRAMSAITAATLGGIEAGIEGPGELSRIAFELDAAETPRRYDPLAMRKTFEPLDAAAVRRRASDGSARFVAGGRGDVVAEAARLWIDKRSSSGIAHPVQVASEKDIAEVEIEARRRCLQAGMLGPQQRSVALAAAGGGRRVVALANGDAIVFTDKVNGRIGKSRGRVASSGSPAIILALDDDGMMVRTMRGEAEVSWRALFDPKTDTMNLRLGYAAAWPCRAGHGGVAAILEGSWNTCRLGLPLDTVALFDEELELAQLKKSHHGEEPGVEELWEAVAANVSLRRRPALIERLEGSRRMLKFGRLVAAFLVENGSGRARGLSSAARAEGIAEAIEPVARAIDARAASLEQIVVATKAASDEGARAPRTVSLGTASPSLAQTGTGSSTGPSTPVSVQPFADALDHGSGTLTGSLDGRSRPKRTAGIRANGGPVRGISTDVATMTSATSPGDRQGDDERDRGSYLSRTGGRMEQGGGDRLPSGHQAVVRETNVSSEQEEEGLVEALDMATLASSVVAEKLRIVARRLKRFALREKLVRLADRIEAILDETRRSTLTPMASARPRSLEVRGTGEAMKDASKAYVSVRCRDLSANPSSTATAQRSIEGGSAAAPTRIQTTGEKARGATVGSIPIGGGDASGDLASASDASTKQFGKRAVVKTGPSSSETNKATRTNKSPGKPRPDRACKPAVRKHRGRER